jgi:hypothetical protein
MRVVLRSSAAWLGCVSKAFASLSKQQQQTLLKTVGKEIAVYGLGLINSGS